ncbi:putative SOS response-associated peptidase YedK [Hasllibacter halocynthiae]|uniref:Abasic site processing protein n=1 Tax=Hasllibacter halocynthiae TaxID=595589 RepID=A0A2T0X9G8_9RHOB|nr:SOS response-associated peptidase [Hasllibacter halocynthiae]PRY95590.1 putative SOS response-associated peptidase YedK [Hasllibacter halocynthiae]
MCGRYAITLPPEAMRDAFDADLVDNGLPPVPNWNVCPTNRIPAIAREGGVRRLTAFRWGLVPRWYAKPNGGPLLINARAETVAEKPAFRDAVRERRCLIPADGFYEWTKDADGNRLPWWVTRRDGAPMVFGGLWQPWGRDGEALRAAAIVTVEAGPDVAAIHHRQPLILRPGDWALWLGEEGHGAAALMRPSPEGTMDAVRVSTEVNSNRAAGEGLVRPINPA